MDETRRLPLRARPAGDGRTDPDARPVRCAGSTRVVTGRGDESSRGSRRHGAWTPRRIGSRASRPDGRSGAPSDAPCRTPPPRASDIHKRRFAGARCRPQCAQREGRSRDVGPGRAMTRRSAEPFGPAPSLRSPDSSPASARRPPVTWPPRHVAGHRLPANYGVARMNIGSTWPPRAGGTHGHAGVGQSRPLIPRPGALERGTAGRCFDVRQMLLGWARSLQTRRVASRSVVPSATRRAT